MILNLDMYKGLFAFMHEEIIPQFYKDEIIFDMEEDRTTIRFAIITELIDILHEEKKDVSVLIAGRFDVFMPYVIYLKEIIDKEKYEFKLSESGLILRHYQTNSTVTISYIHDKLDNKKIYHWDLVVYFKKVFFLKNQSASKLLYFRKLITKENLDLLKFHSKVITKELLDQYFAYKTIGKGV